MDFQKILYYLRPGTLLRNRKSSPILSKMINDLLDDGYEPELESSYVVKLGDLKLWIANFPYEYGKLHDTALVDIAKMAVLKPGSFEWNLILFRMKRDLELARKYKESMPDRATVYRLHKAVELKKRTNVPKPQSSNIHLPSPQ